LCGFGSAKETKFGAGSGSVTRKVVDSGPDSKLDFNFSIYHEKIDTVFYNYDTENTVHYSKIFFGKFASKCHENALKLLAL
jgi:hypothetical protein